MACVLIPKYNFLNGYFRCPLPSETVDVEVKVKMMRGIHMFRRDRTMCNTWSTRLHPYPTFIRKMKTYLELEGKLCPKPRLQTQTQSQPCTSTPPQNNNPITRKAPGPKMMEKKRRTRVPAKRRYKVRVIAHPLPTTPSTSVPVNSIPTPTIAMSNGFTQKPIVNQQPCPSW